METSRLTKISFYLCLIFTMTCLSFGCISHKQEARTPAPGKNQPTQPAKQQNMPIAIEQAVDSPPQDPFSIQIPSNLPVITPSNINNLVELQSIGQGIYGWYSGYNFCWSDEYNQVGIPTTSGVFLYDLASLDHIVVPGSKSDVFQCSFLPDGETIAMLRRTGGIDYFDLGQNKIVKTVGGFVGEPVWMSADATVLMTSTGLWRTKDGLKFIRFERDQNNGRISPDGKRYVSGLDIWEVRGDAVQPLYEIQNSGWGYYESPDLSIAILINEDTDSIILWDAIQNQKIVEINIEFPIQEYIVSQGNNYLVGWNKDEIVVWSIPSGEKLYRLPIHTQWMRLALNSEKMLGVFDDGTMVLWELRSGKELVSQQNAFPFGPIDVSASSNGETGVFQFLNGDIRLYDFVANKTLSVIEPYIVDDPGYETFGGGLVMSDDGARFALGGNLEPFVWNIENLAHPVRSACEGVTRGLTFSPDGKLLACGSFRTVDITSTADGSLIAKLPASEGWIGFVAFSPDGKYLFSSDYDLNSYEGSVNIWDTNSWSKVNQLSIGKYTVSFAVSPINPILAAGIESGDIELFNLPDGSRLQNIATQFEGEGSVNVFAFSPDGNMLGVGSSAGDLSFIDLNSNKIVRTINSEVNLESITLITSISFVLNGSVIIATDQSGIMRIWGVNDNETHLTGQTPPSGVFASAAQAPYIAAASQGIQIYDIRDTPPSVRLQIDNAILPKWSPDGKYLAYWVGGDQENKPTPQSGAWIYDVATSENRQIYSSAMFQGVTFSKYGYDYAWSADSSAIYFPGEDIKHRNGLYRIKTDRSAPPELFLDASYPITQFSFSPDGRWLAWQTGTLENSKINYMDLTNQEVSTLNLPEGIGGWNPAWSPDGRQIAYLAVGTDATHQIPQLVLADIETGNQKYFTVQDPSMYMFINYLDGDSAPAWSPDDQYIAVGGVFEQKSQGIYLISLKDGAVKSLTQSLPFEIYETSDIEWSPDSKYVIYKVRDPSGSFTKEVGYYYTSVETGAIDQFLIEADDLEWIPKLP